MAWVWDKKKQSTARINITSTFVDKYLIYTYVHFFYQNKLITNANVLLILTLAKKTVTPGYNFDFFVQPFNKVDRCQTSLDYLLNNVYCMFLQIK